MDKNTIRYVPVSEVERFAKACLVAVGTPEDIAEAQARLIAETDKRGYFGHGITKLDVFIRDITSGLIDPKAKPSVLNETTSTAMINGNNGLGAYTGIFCMEKAIAKAKISGVGWVTCKEANYNGMEEFYALIALRQGMIGLAFTNNSAVVVPTRAKTNAIGTNPLCMGAPARGDDYFLLDICTSGVALGKIELYKKNKWDLPIGWAMDDNGRQTTEADYAYKVNTYHFSLLSFTRNLAGPNQNEQLRSMKVASTYYDS